jgi:transposase
MMTDKRRTYTAEFKREAVHLVTEQGYALAEAARNLGLNSNMLRRWKRELVEQEHAAFPGNGRVSLAQEELHRVREENKRLRMERDMLKNLSRHAAVSLVAGETPRPRVSCRGGRSGRQLIGGGYHPVKKRGPGNNADWRVVTPWGDPV